MALKALDGLRVRARLTLTRNHEELWCEDGEVLFRTFGISGVAAFNLSRRIQHGDTILLDIFPDLSKDELLDMLNRRVELLGRFSPHDPRWLDGMLAPQLSRVVCTAFEQCHPDSNDVIHLVSILKHFKLLVEGTAEERSAQVTRGGIPIETVSIPGLRANDAVDAPLYVCGEALDIDADCGGFNLAWAWISAFALQVTYSRAVYNQNAFGPSGTPGGLFLASKETSMIETTQVKASLESRR